MRIEAKRGLASLLAMAHELRGAWRVTSSLSSFGRFATDLVLYRFVGRLQIPGENRERTIRLRDDVTLTYRLNRGDIQSIREVWIDEAYRLPFERQPGVLVDLGANIGLTSLWLVKRYGCKRVIAVEPSSSNARLARINFARNAIPGEILEAAIGPEDGTAKFATDRLFSNLGQVSDTGGDSVEMVSMATVLRNLGPTDDVDLLKMDIEGGEQALLDGEDLSWLERIHSIIAELHPAIIDYPGVLRKLQQSGFSYIPAGSAHQKSMDAFVRKAPIDEAQRPAAHAAPSDA